MLHTLHILVKTLPWAFVPGLFVLALYFFAGMRMEDWPEDD